MKISVRLFARARELAGADSTELICPPEATIGELKQLLIEKHPALEPMLDSLLIAVDREFATEDFVLSEDAEVACFPPVSGG
jgi:molybdopterin converting factor subunit 1